MLVALPAEPVGDDAAAEAADHPADGEDRNCNGEDDFLPAFGNVLIVALRVRLADKVLDHLDTTNRVLIISSNHRRRFKTTTKSPNISHDFD